MSEESNNCVSLNVINTQEDFPVEGGKKNTS